MDISGVRFCLAIAALKFQHGTEIDSYGNTVEEHAMFVVSTVYPQIIVNSKYCVINVASRPIVSEFFYPIGLPPVYSWSSWSRFGSCSSTCGEGVMTSTRACKSTGCIGHHIRTQVCTKPSCHQGNE